MSCPEGQDCRPCDPSLPEPVLPRCDVVLPDGTYTNATVTVEDGCITAVAAGLAPLYTPDVCCTGTGSGGGGGGGDDPCDCPPGDPGENATIAVGQVFGVAPNAPAQVVNVGTTTNAVLEFYIPRGAPGDDGTPPNGVTNTTAGLAIQNGAITSLPGAWPPALAFLVNSSPLNVSLTVSQPDPTSGLVTVDLSLDQFLADIEQWVNNQITAATTPLETRITNLEQQVNAQALQIAGILNQLSTCCP